jgi:orotate phosphoribosyltransferase
MTNAEILKIFEETEGILHGHFQLASGRHSDTYMQCAKLFMYPDKAKILCNALADKMKNEKIEYVASPAVGGIIMGYEMANQLKVPNIFLERINGNMTVRRGFEIVKNGKYLVVEDVVTTGGSVKEVIEEIEKRGGIVTAVCSVVDRSNGNVDFGKKYYSLLSMDIISFEKEDCPLCKKNIPVLKPGTKALTAK